MVEVRDTSDLELRREVHIALLHALENSSGVLTAAQNPSRVGWAEVRAALRLGIFKRRPSTKKVN